MDIKTGLKQEKIKELNWQLYLIISIFYYLFNLCLLDIQSSLPYCPSHQKRGKWGVINNNGFCPTRANGGRTKPIIIIKHDQSYSLFALTAPIKSGPFLSSFVLFYTFFSSFFCSIFFVKVQDYFFLSVTFISWMSNVTTEQWAIPPQKNPNTGDKVG